MSDDGKLEAQCWICPRCFDDHAMGGPCNPEKIVKRFMPAPDDLSGIANAYRERMSEIADLESQIIALARALELKVLDKHPLLVFNGPAEQYMSLASGLRKVKRLTKSLENVTVIGMPETSRLEALSDTELARMGLQRIPRKAED